jgi:hypothetical protein
MTWIGGEDNQWNELELEARMGEQRRTYLISGSSSYYSFATQRMLNSMGPQEDIADVVL